MAIPEKVLTEPVTLPKTGTWPETRHQFDEKSLWAIKAAVAAERPLLVRGEPGTGKSQLARAAAYYLGRAFISEVVHSRSECQDLQYYFDAVARLGAAQTLGLIGAVGDTIKDLLPDSERNMKNPLDPICFLNPGALWWAFNWTAAEKQYAKSNKAARRPEKPVDWTSEQGTVLLIDEIDKADADLPNGFWKPWEMVPFPYPIWMSRFRSTRGIRFRWSLSQPMKSGSCQPHSYAGAWCCTSIYRKVMTNSSIGFASAARFILETSAIWM